MGKVDVFVHAHTNARGMTIALETFVLASKRVLFMSINE